MIETNKIYKFDYLKEWVNEWNDKTHVTRNQLGMLPLGINILTHQDYYKEIIENVEDWNKQREEYLDRLWVELGSYTDDALVLI